MTKTRHNQIKKQTNKQKVAVQWWPHRMSLGVFLPLLYFGRVKDTDVENGLEDTGRGEDKLGQSESGMAIYTLPNIK